MIQRVASSSFPEKSVGRAALSSAVCEDMVGAGVTRGAGVGAGDKGCTGDEDGKGWGFPWRRGRVAEVKMLSTG